MGGSFPEELWVGRDGARRRIVLGGFGAAQAGTVGQSEEANEPSLSIGIPLDVALRGLDRAVSGKLLHVAEGAAGLVNQAGRPSYEGAPAGVGGAALEPNRDV